MVAVLDQPVKGLDDKPFKEGESNLTIRMVLKRSLVSTYADELPQPGGGAGIDGETKFLRYALARDIWRTEKDITLTQEDWDEIIKCVGKGYGPEVVGFVYELLGHKVKK